MAHEHEQSNKIWPSRKRRFDISVRVRKVSAASVPYGSSISRNGRTVWAAYDSDGALVTVAATSAEARSRYLRIKDDEIAKALWERNRIGTQNL